MLWLLAMVAGLGSLICWIIVLIKQFQDGGALHGIIGIITCGLWTLIWGWMNATRLNIKNIMMIWTLLIIVNILLNFVFGAAMFTMTPAAPTNMP